MNNKDKRTNAGKDSNVSKKNGSKKDNLDTQRLGLTNDEKTWEQPISNEEQEKSLLTSQEEKIKKNASKSSTRKKVAVTTAIVLLLIAGVTVPTAVYLARRKVTVDVETNVEIIEEYTINVKRGVTIKDIVPQEIKGYTFVGFFKDAALTNPYKDTDKINKRQDKQRHNDLCKI